VIAGVGRSSQRDGRRDGEAPHPAASGERGDAQASGVAPAQRLDAVAWLVVGFAALRLAYHLTYLAEVPFAIVTFSDGRAYETMARDLLEHPPWGSEPFWLQGAYAAFMAVPMAVWPEPTAALLLQLLVCSVAWWSLWRALRGLTDRRTARVVLLLWLALDSVMFYENKFLTGALAVASLVAMVWALVRLRGTARVRDALALGVATGIAILLRGNMLLALPTTFVAAAIAVPRSARWRCLGGVALGLACALIPMALRNEIVTDRPTILPAHGGGTSFYIGNHAGANGVWNDAGGLLSGDVTQERREVAARLDITERDEAARDEAIGRRLYERARADIAADPVRWARLLARKLWLTLGNDELNQDYDRRGERELVGGLGSIGVPFGVLLTLTMLSLVALVLERPHGAPTRAVLWLVAGQALAVLAANVLFFTSAQHRLPLVVPCVVAIALSPPWRGWGRASRRRRVAAITVAAIVLAATLVPRTRRHEISPAHDYNLALAWRAVGEDAAAMASLDRALSKRPEHPTMLLERASLALDLGRADVARADLEHLATLGELPPALVDRRAAVIERLATFDATSR
jgi:hypothetical protein